VKLFSAIAGIALVFAAMFFLRYSIDRGWLQPPVRVAIGIATAIALLIACELKAARKYPATANAMDAAAIAILFATFFSAHSLWNLIPAAAAFVLLALVTATAVLLSIRRESLFIAILGLVGGFATPVLLSTGENQPVPLFAYLLLLNIGLAWVAYRRGWSILSGLSLVLTTLYQWGWVIKYLSESPLPLALGVFIVFAVVGFGGFLLARSRPGTQDHTDDPAFRWTAMVSAALPLLFAAYVAAVPAYGDEYALLFGYLFLVAAGLFAVAVAMEQEELHALGAAATVIVFAVWLTFSYPAGAWPVVLAFVALFGALYLAAPSIAARFDRGFDGVGAAALYTAPVLLFTFAALMKMEPALASPAAAFGVLLVFMAVVVWRAVATGDGALYYVAAFFALAAEAVWSATHLTVERLPEALVLYGVFGVMYLGVPVLARRLGRPLLPAHLAGGVLIASLALLLFLTTGSVAGPAIWGMALLLAILNAALFVESAAARLPLLSIAGSALSWVVLLSWWTRAAGSVGVMPSLLVLVGLTLIMLGGHSWVHRRTAAAEAGPRELTFSSGLWLALVGHVFLYTVAISREWSLPPWPLFGALAVIVLGASTASIAVRTPTLHGASAVAASIVLFAWSTVARDTGWSTVSVAAHGVLVAFALVWTMLSRRVGADSRAAIAAALVLAGALIDLTSTGATATAPLAVLLGANVTFISLLLALVAIYRWRNAATLTALLGAVSVAAFSAPANSGPDAWWPLLAHGVAMYLPFAIYPLALGRRASGSRDPYVAALIAGVWCFLAARHAVMQTEYAWMIGIVPIAIGAITTVHLRMLLRIQPAGERDLGRLALVAGAALGFLTVAIPLQLREQWITIGWALEGAAVAWLFRRIPHRGLLYAATALLGAVFVRLVMNPEVLRYEPAGSIRIFNWYLYAYATCAAAMFLAAWWLAKTDDRLLPALPRARHIMAAAGGVVLFVLLNIEIADFYADGPDEMFRFGVSIAQDLTYTIGWLVFGLLTLAAGIVLNARAARVAAVVLVTVTTLKCFLYDLGSLGGLARVGAFVGLALSLILVSLALQKYVLAPRETA
jgi:uncharacterized membrane protein